MADRSTIEWTDATWNPVIGCRVISPGCTHCYAMRLAGTRLRHTDSRDGLTQQTKAGPVWNGAVRFIRKWLDQPLHWATPRDVFVCAHSDLFYENVDRTWIDQIFAVMRLANWHDYQVLTKRSQAMADYLLDPLTPARVAGWAQVMLDARRSRRRFAAPLAAAWPPRNVIVGVSAETDAWFRQRIGPLAQLKPAGWRTWASLEPLLGSIDITAGQGTLDWIVAGGESGAGARPMHPHWVRAVRDQCAALRIPFFFKQWGEWLPWLQFNDTPGVVDDSLYQSRFKAMIWDDDEFVDHGGGWDDDRAGADGPDGSDQIMGRVGKRAAGAVLDGREWRQMPERARDVR